MTDLKFTDDDLKKWKKQFEFCNFPVKVSGIQLAALLARLEKSECIANVVMDYHDVRFVKEIKEWLESCGR